MCITEAALKAIQWDVRRALFGGSNVLRSIQRRRHPWLLQYAPEDGILEAALHAHAFLPSLLDPGSQRSLDRLHLMLASLLRLRASLGPIAPGSEPLPIAAGRRFNLVSRCQRRRLLQHVLQLSREKLPL